VTNTKKKTDQPKELPLTGYVSIRVLLLFLPMSASTIWRNSKNGNFPKSRKLSEKITAWKAEEVHEWLDNLGKEVQS